MSPVSNNRGCSETLPLHPILRARGFKSVTYVVITRPWCSSRPVMQPCHDTGAISEHGIAKEAACHDATLIDNESTTDMVYS